MSNSKIIKETTVLNFLLIFTVLVFLIKIFYFYEHYPILDEVIVLDRFFEWKNFLRKDLIGNHTINSFIGVILKTLFGYNFELLRFISFFCFIIILIFFRLMFNKIYLYLFFISQVIFSNILFNYMYIFRGYYVHALLCVVSFYFLKKYFLNGKNSVNLNIILFLIFTQLAHSLFTVYIAIPMLILIFLEHLRKKELIKYSLNYTFFFIIPIFLTFLFYSFLDGFVYLHNSNLNFDYLINNFFLIFIDCVIYGYKGIFFSSYTETNYLALLGTIQDLYKGYDYALVGEPIILFIYFLSLTLCVFTILAKKASHLDFLILIIFLFFILLFKQPTPRVHIGPAIFCLFYIIDSMNNFISKFNLKQTNSYLTTCVIVFFLLILSVSPNKNFQGLKNEIIIINKYKHNCNLANVELNSSEKWILINFFPDACKYRYDGKDNVLF